MTSENPISLRIGGEEGLLQCVPGQWLSDLYKPGAHTEIVMCLTKDSMLSDCRFPAGWSYGTVGGIPKAVFAPNGKASFALAYGGLDDTVTVSVRKALDGFVRPGIQYGLLTALHGRCVGLHGVTLQCGGKTVILSAPSGTGKTTLATLLVANCGARIINGDFALLSVDRDGVWFEPTPFCGTSGICLNERVRVDHVVFLSQGVENSWRPLSAREAMTNFFSNAFVPTFDRLLMQDVQGSILRMISLLELNSYVFAPTEKAAHLFRTYLPDSATVTQKIKEV